MQNHFKLSLPTKLYINNDHRAPNMSADQFSISLETTLERPRAVMLNKASIPLTGYNIPSYQSNFSYIQATGTAMNPVIVNGSVKVNVNRFFNSPIELIREVNLALANAGVSLVLSHDPDPSSSTYDAYAVSSQTYRVTIKNTSVTGVSYALPGYNQVWSTMGERLGFTQASQTPWILTNSSITAESPCNLQRTSCIYVAGDFSTNDGITNSLATGSSLGNAFRNIITSIPVTVPFGGLVTYNDSNGSAVISTEYLPESIRSIGLALLDDNFKPLDLPSSCICCFEFLVNY